MSNSLDVIQKDSLNASVAVPSERLATSPGVNSKPASALANVENGNAMGSPGNSGRASAVPNDPPNDASSIDVFAAQIIALSGEIDTLLEDLATKKFGSLSNGLERPNLEEAIQKKDSRLRSLEEQHTYLLEAFGSLMDENISIEKEYFENIK